MTKALKDMDSGSAKTLARGLSASRSGKEAEGCRDLLLEVAAHAHAGDPADDLAHEEAEGEGVVAVAGARLPPWLFSGEGGRHHVPVVEGAPGQDFA